jgi:hypothetical protein
VERFLQIEQNDYRGTIERRRRALEAETARITKDHHQRFAIDVQAFSKARCYPCGSPIYER